MGHRSAPSSMADASERSVAGLISRSARNADGCMSLIAHHLRRGTTPASPRRARRSRSAGGSPRTRTRAVPGRPAARRSVVVQRPGCAVRIASSGDRRFDERGHVRTRPSLRGDATDVVDGLQQGGHVALDGQQIDSARNGVQAGRRRSRSAAGGRPCAGTDPRAGRRAHAAPAPVRWCRARRVRHRSGRSERAADRPASPVVCSRATRRRSATHSRDGSNEPSTGGSVASTACSSAVIAPMRAAVSTRWSRASEPSSHASTSSTYHRHPSVAPSTNSLTAATTRPPSSIAPTYRGM